MWVCCCFSLFIRSFCRSLFADLERDRCRKLDMLRDMQSVHQLRVVSGLEAELEAAVARLRREHLANVAVELDKIRADTAAMEDEINAHFEQERKEMAVLQRRVVDKKFVHSRSARAGAAREWRELQQRCRCPWRAHTFACTTRVRLRSPLPTLIFFFFSLFFPFCPPPPSTRFRTRQLQKELDVYKAKREEVVPPAHLAKLCLLAHDLESSQ